MTAALTMERQGGGMMGPNTNVKIGEKWLGHFYDCADDDVDADEVLSEVARRYNSHDMLVETLKDVLENGLIYWEPATARGLRCKAEMVGRISALLAQQGGPA